MSKNFFELLRAQWQKGKFLCVGLDSEWEKIPEQFKTGRSIREAILKFNKSIILATMGVAAAYKPNIAFYEWSEEALLALQDTIAFIQKEAPEIPVILDCKRGDIGNTNKGYVASAFDRFKADAVTVHNYFGFMAMSPFLDRADKGVIVMCHTSNKGAHEFQDLPVVDPKDGKSLIPLYQLVARHIADPLTWNKNGNCGIVMGATYPQQLEPIRDIVGNMLILIPGIGSQGGDLEKSLLYGLDNDGQGVLINSSSGIIFAENPGEAAELLNDQIVTGRKQILTQRQTA